MRRLTVALAFALTVSLSACTTPAPSDNVTQTLDVGTGEVFRISLSGNPTTGYLWRMEPTEAIESVSEHFEASDTTGRRVGAPGVFHFDLRAKHPSNVTLRFRYERPWEKEENGTVRTYRIRVHQP